MAFSDIGDDQISHNDDRLLLESFRSSLRRGAPWHGKLARDLQQVLSKVKEFLLLHPTRIYYKVINFSRKVALYHIFQDMYKVHSTAN
jgi:hypothetical protein